MTTKAAAKPHPALALKGFTRSVTLSTGIEVHIRKLDRQAVIMSEARRATGVAGGELEGAAQVGLIIDIQRRTLKAALVQPSLAELMETYGGTEEDPDLGLGDDLTTIMTAIDEFTPQTPEVSATVQED